MNKKLILVYPWDNLSSFNEINSKKEFTDEIRGGHLFDLLHYFASNFGIESEVIRFYNHKLSSEKLDKFNSGNIDGVNVKLIPVNDKYLLSKLYNKNFFNYINKQYYKHEIYLILNGLHFWLTYQIGFLSRKIPVICSQAGTRPPKFREGNVLINSVKTAIERLSFTGIDRFYAVSPYTTDYLSDLLGEKILFEYLYAKHSKLYFNISKEEARKTLGLDISKKIVLFVGRISHGKGAHNFIELKKLMQNKDIEFIMVGSISNEDLYKKATSLDIKVVGKVLKEDMILYYNSADIFVECEFDDEVVKFGGIGSAVVESLMCDRPVIGKALRLLPFRNLDKFIPENISEAAHLVDDILKNPKIYKDCGTNNLIKESYDIKYIYPKFNDLLSELNSKYYTKK